ncbi:hypothetical protein V6N13_001331 [Hibiscus sabdariffa]
MSIKTFVWNAQGCGSCNFVRVTKQYICDNKPDVCVFVEPRLSQKRAGQVIASLGFPNSYRVEALGFSGGIWLYCEYFLATFVYASPTRSFRQELWHHLVNLSTSVNIPWVVLGDFNATLSLADRQRCTSASLERSFQDMVSDCGLHDLCHSGPNFTWSYGNCNVHLDRCFGNAHWFERFPRSLLHHLLRMKSDHKPIFLSTDDQVPATRSHAFKYFAG